MTPNAIANILEKTAEHVAGLEAENYRLKDQLGRERVLHSSGDTLTKVASAADMDTDSVYDALSTLNTEQKKIFSKLASEDSFALGEVSDFDSNEGRSADDDLLGFMEA